ncbi:MAG: PA2778 family cysteine peptidase [Burkholderiaceae bacterium]
MHARTRAAARVCGALALAVVLGGCAALQTRSLQAAPPPDLAAAVELDATPFFPQTAYECGPAALATALGAAGLPASPEELGAAVFLPARTGSLQIEMIAGARRQGAVATRLPRRLDAVLREVRAGHPVVVLQNLGLSWYPAWHYAVVVGYDVAAGDVILRSGTTRRENLPMRTFEHTWVRAGSWAFVALPPDRLPHEADEAAVVEASVGYERVAAPTRAAVAYRSALARWPGNLSLAMGLGNSLYAAGDRSAAADVFRRAAESHRSAAAWINLGETLLDLGQAEAALSAAQAAAAIDDAAWQPQAQALLRRVQADPLARP